MKVRPLQDRILVRPLEEEEVKQGGIIIPDTAKEKPQEGKVVAVGSGRVLSKRARRSCMRNTQAPRAKWMAKSC